MAAMTRAHGGLVIAALLVACCIAGSEAFCIYNSCSTDITAFQLPIGTSSYKGNIKAGTPSKPESGCCNWKDCGPDSPQAGRCSNATFCMIIGNQNIDRVEASAVLDKISTALIKSFDFIPGVGAIGAANDAAKDQLKNFGLNCDAVVTSYNGGVVECNDDNKGGHIFHGSWDGVNASPPPGTADC